MPESEIDNVKSKLRNTCEKYCHVNVPSKHIDIVIRYSYLKNISKKNSRFLLFLNISAILI